MKHITHEPYKYIHMRITNNEETIRITNWIDFTEQNMTKNVKKKKIGSN